MDFAEQLLGLLLVIYAALSLLVPFCYSGKANRFYRRGGRLVDWHTTGLTGSFVVPSIMFLQAIRLSVAEFAQATGLLFSLLTLSLGFSLFIAGRLSVDITMYSLSGVVPAFIGMFIGYQIRTKLKMETFRMLLNSGLLIIGFEMLLVPLFS